MNFYTTIEVAVRIFGMMSNVKVHSVPLSHQSKGWAIPPLTLMTF